MKKKQYIVGAGSNHIREAIETAKKLQKIESINVCVVIDFSLSPDAGVDVFGYAKDKKKED